MIHCIKAIYCLPSSIYYMCIVQIERKEKYALLLIQQI